MANPQKENGYVAVANELFDQLFSRKFTHSELRILLFAIRYTYGFNRKDATLSNKYISRGTGIHEVKVSSTVNQMIRDKILIETKHPTFSTPRKLAVNKNYDSWLNHELLIEQLPPNDLVKGGVNDSVKLPPNDLVKGGVNETVNQDNTDIRKTEKERQGENAVPSEPKYDDRGRMLNSAGLPIIDWGIGKYGGDF